MAQWGKPPYWRAWDQVPPLLPSQPPAKDPVLGFLPPTWGPRGSGFGLAQPKPVDGRYLLFYFHSAFQINFKKQQNEPDVPASLSVLPSHPAGPVAASW